MTIYQVHIIGGSYEDAYDFLSGSYLHKEKAEDHRELLIKMQKQNIENCNFCANCPIQHMTKRMWNRRKDEVAKYCKSPEIEFRGNSVWCNNQLRYDEDELEESYKIEEVEVIE